MKEDIVTIKEREDGNSKDLMVFGNSRYLGDLIQEVDGYYYMRFTDENNGLYTPSNLRLIADAIDKYNKPWDDSIAEYFKNNPVELNNDGDFIIE